MSLVYLDSSAIVKLVRREPETRALLAFLRAWPQRVTSSVAEVEVTRAVRQRGMGGPARRRAERVLERIDLVELDDSIRRRAAGLDPAGLRTLDAIHVATALDIGSEVSIFVTYDERQSDAARPASLQVVSPGR